MIWYSYRIEIIDSENSFYMGIKVFLLHSTDNFIDFLTIFKENKSRNSLDIKLRTKFNKLFLVNVSLNQFPRSVACLLLFLKHWSHGFTWTTPFGMEIEDVRSFGSLLKFFCIFYMSYFSSCFQDTCNHLIRKYYWSNYQQYL